MKIKKRQPQKHKNKILKNKIFNYCIMSVYSRTLKPQVFEPRVDNKQRVEFKLDIDSVYLPNLRLANLGALLTGGADVYNAVGGVTGGIRRITLYDGAVELDKLHEAGKYLSWIYQAGTNNNNRYVGQSLLKHRIGYLMRDNCVVDGKSSLTATGEHGIELNTGSQQQIEVRSGLFDLRQALPLLGELSCLDTALFENLRLVIEYEPSGALNGKLEQGYASNALNNTLEHTTPLLLVDEIVDPAAAQRARSQLKSLVYQAIEHDMVQLPAKDFVLAAAGGDPGDGAGGRNATPEQDQEQTLLIDGYKNKIVNRLVIHKCYTNVGRNRVAANNVAGNAIRGVGPHASHAQHRERVQMVVNGRNLFTSSGLEGPAQIADAHADAWGSYNILPFSNQESVGLDSFGAVAPSNVFGAPEHQNLQPSLRVGQSSYIGMRIQDRIVGDLQLKYKRSVVGDSRSPLNGGGGNSIHPTGEQLDLHVFAEIPKEFQMMGGGKYRINYL